MSLLRALNHVPIPIGSSVPAIASAQGFIAASRAADHPILLVTSSSRRADELAAELSTYLGEDHVITFPPWETLPHERLSPKSDTIAARYKALH
ncbi:MAG: hypothetical protein RL414_1316, partial [Actinomycetota bacterium]